MHTTHEEFLSELVLACRVLFAAKLGNGPSGFLAARDLDGRGLWVTPDDLGFDEVESHDFVLVSFSGDVVFGEGEPDEECAMATDVMFAEPHINALVHLHSLYATAFSATPASLHALSHEGCHIVPPDVARVRLTDTNGATKLLARVLKERNAALLSDHGMVTSGESIGIAVSLAVYLERACQLQLMVGPSGHVVSDEEVLEKRSGQLARPSISWSYLQRVLPH